MRVYPHRNPQSPRKTKISNLQRALGIDEQVLGFQVTVKDTPRVTEDHALKQLLHIFLHWSKEEVRVNPPSSTFHNVYIIS